MKGIGTYSLSSKTLAEDLGILVDEEVGYGRVVITASRRLRERPAPGCLDGMEWRESTSVHTRRECESEHYLRTKATVQHDEASEERKEESCAGSPGCAHRVKPLPASLLFWHHARAVAGLPPVKSRSNHSSRRSSAVRTHCRRRWRVYHYRLLYSRRMYRYTSFLAALPYSRPSIGPTRLRSRAFRDARRRALIAYFTLS